jgi:hypothetical protein
MAVIARSEATRQSTGAHAQRAPTRQRRRWRTNGPVLDGFVAFGLLAMTGGRNDPASPAPARRS